MLSVVAVALCDCFMLVLEGDEKNNGGVVGLVVTSVIVELVIDGFICFSSSPSSRLLFWMSSSSPSCFGVSSLKPANMTKTPLQNPSH